MKNRIQALDGLRGIAILLVLAGHGVAHFQPLEAGWRQWLGAYANSGAGVRLFFVLSGYLITHLLLREQDATGTIGISKFYQRRAWRILPAFFVYLLTITGLSLWQPMGITLQTFLAAATFTWNYQAFWVAPPLEGTWNLGHLWTLALEQQFYLFWPLVMAALSRRGAFGWAIGLLLWCPLARIGSYFLFPSQRGMISMMLHTSIDPLMAGCATALLLHSVRGLAWWRPRAGLLATAGALWLFLLSPAVATTVRGFQAAAGFSLDALAAGAIIAWAHLAPGWLASHVLGVGALPALGVISYSLYLWQQVFFAPDGGLARGQWLLPLAGAVAAAIASYWLVEKPCLARQPRVALPANSPLSSAR